MVDAAIAIEAFDGAITTDSLMAHEDWFRPDGSDNYPERLWASEWWNNPALPPEDARRMLTWRNRLSRTTNAIVYNFFSSGEEVLAPPEPTTPNLVGFVGGQLWNLVFGDSPCGERSWVLQEKLKGRTAQNEILGSSYGGWGFNTAWDVFVDGPSITRHRTPAETEVLLDANLVNRPFFIPGPAALHGVNGSNYASANANSLLADMIPARTRAAGGNEIQSRKFVPLDGENRNFDMSVFENGWPQERQSSRWLHSDIKDVAFQFTFPVFDRFVALANLNE